MKTDTRLHRRRTVGSVVVLIVMLTAGVRGMAAEPSNVAKPAFAVEGTNTVSADSGMILGQPNGPRLGSGPAGSSNTNSKDATSVSVAAKPTGIRVGSAQIIDSHGRVHRLTFESSGETWDAAGYLARAEEYNRRRAEVEAELERLRLERIAADEAWAREQAAAQAQSPPADYDNSWWLGGGFYGGVNKGKGHRGRGRGSADKLPPPNRPMHGPSTRGHPPGQPGRGAAGLPASVTTIYLPARR